MSRAAAIIFLLLATACAASAPAAAGPLEGVKLCVDPGHPSENGSGCTGAGGTTELHIAWVVSNRLAQLLRAAGATVVLTKSSEEEYVSNRRRAEIANAAGVALAVRLHCDSGGGSGFAFYYPDHQGTVHGVTGPSAAVLRGSKQAAEGVYPAMKEKLTGYLPSRGLHTEADTLIGGRQGALTGSIFSKVPIFTIEMVMLTQSADEKFIRTSPGQWKMAGSIKAGIMAYLGHQQPVPAAAATRPAAVPPPPAPPPAPAFPWGWVLGSAALAAALGVSLWHLLARRPRPAGSPYGGIVP
jgi:N-acetylmuramoyl-L-alanine amidase